LEQEGEVDGIDRRAVSLQRWVSTLVQSQPYQWRTTAEDLDLQDQEEEGHRLAEYHGLIEEEKRSARKTTEVERRRPAISLGSLVGRHGNEEEMRRDGSVRLPNATYM
jgi:hypothetical protein